MDRPTWYSIHIQEHLDARWADWFENMTLAAHTDGTTTLTGPVADQTALYGLLDKLRDLGLQLITVQRDGRPPVEIAPYRESWIADFRVIAARLRTGLGDMALRIDHIGSTAVPGLAAQDVIDIQITVAALTPAVEAAMAASGYTCCADPRRDHHPAGAQGPEVDGEKWLFDTPAGERGTHTHVRVVGRGNQRYALLFRDFLRAHPAAAEAYAEQKRRLAHHLADPRAYPEVKDPAVDLIYLAAEDWARATDWQLGLADG